MRQADALPRRFKSGRMHHIVDLLRLDRCIDRCHLQFYIVGILCLICRKGGILAPLLQLVGGAAQGFGDLRMIGCDKSRYQFRHDAETAPLVFCEEFHFAGFT